MSDDTGDWDAQNRAETEEAAQVAVDTEVKAARDKAILDKKRASLELARKARAANARTAKPRTAKDAKIGVMAHPEPATRRNEPTRESYRPDAPEQFTRRKRADRGVGNFDIPAHRRKWGWDYQYITITVLNQPVDGARIRDFREGGWRPVLARDWPELADSTASPDAPIELEGQRLMERPMHLTMEAKEEDEEVARAAQRDRTLAAAAGGSAHRGSEYAIPSARGVNRVPVSIEIEERMG